MTQASAEDSEGNGLILPLRTPESLGGRGWTGRWQKGEGLPKCLYTQYLSPIGPLPILHSQKTTHPHPTRIIEVCSLEKLSQRALQVGPQLGRGLGRGAGLKPMIQWKSFQCNGGTLCPIPLPCSQHRGSQRLMSSLKNWLVPETKSVDTDIGRLPQCQSAAWWP